MVDGIISHEELLRVTVLVQSKGSVTEITPWSENLKVIFLSNLIVAALVMFKYSYKIV